MSTGKIVVISNSESIARDVQTAAGANSYDWVVYPSPSREILHALVDDSVLGIFFDLVDVSDTRILSFVSLLGDSFFFDRRLPIAVLTSSASRDSELSWPRLGASEVVAWITRDQRIPKLLQAWSLCNKYQQAAAEPRERDGWLSLGSQEQLMMASASMSRIVAKLHRLSNNDCNVLLTGETGVGKTTVAKLLHQLSQRQTAPFCAVNCSALPESLVESELFGNKKGAFTDAHCDRDGWFTTVEDGTLFLDEVDSLPLMAQAKLLKAVDEHEFQIIGDRRKSRFKGRLVSATNRNMQDLIHSKEFRADLFFRLGVVELHIPALRERREEIIPLAKYFLQQSAPSDEGFSFSNEALEMLHQYSWPGNIRELRNMCMQLAAFASSDQIDASELPVEIREAASDSTITSGFDVQESLVAVREREEIRQIKDKLRQTNNNRSQAAELLGISRAAFYKKLGRYQLLSFQG